MKLNLQPEMMITSGSTSAQHLTAVFDEKNINVFMTCLISYLEVCVNEAMLFLAS
jgi:hypothetical protein